MSIITLKNFYQFHKTFENSGIIVAYKGTMSQKGLIEIGSVLRTNLQANDVILRVIKKIFAVFVEEAQNIMKYSADKKKNRDGTETGEGMITIFKKDDHFYIVSGNVIKNSDVEPLENRLDSIASQTKDELRQLAKGKKFNTEKLTGTESAGIGFIEMAIKADKPLEWFFEPTDHQHSFFSLSIAIKYSQES
ncbi:SiaB family protein kinase [candidate division CSSED10-310 bacterium]|uniref:SiaB family protein kinase n=1 Tax=candidate division CSSED10-310 bacterium TaxID=2855610 RepID=A0ABV6YU74_UNCC1